MGAFVATFMFAVFAIAAAVTASARARCWAVWDRPRAVLVRPGRRSKPVGPSLGLVLGTVLVVAWGILTALVFAPFGGLYAVVTLGSGKLASLLIAAVALHGFVIGARLMASGPALMSRDHAALRATGRRVLVHHAAVVAAMLPAGIEAAKAAAIPCGIGVVIGLGLVWRGGSD